MHSKISLPGFLATAVLTGTVLMATIAPSSAACPFSQKSGLSNSNQSSSPSSLTGNSINFNQPHKLGIAGAALAGIFGLWGGSILLKARAAKREHPMADRSATEAIVEYPIFPIEVPAEALNSTEDTEVAEAKSAAIR